MEIPPDFFPPVVNTPTAAPLTVFNPQRDLPAYWTPPNAQWANALESVAPTINEKITQQSQAGESWVTTLQRILPALATTVQQREILKIQLERARQGLPPLDNSQFGAQVSVGLDNRTMMLLGAAAVGIAALLFLRRNR